MHISLYLHLHLHHLYSYKPAFHFQESYHVQLKMKLQSKNCCLETKELAFYQQYDKHILLSVTNQISAPLSCPLKIHDRRLSFNASAILYPVS